MRKKRGNNILYIATIITALAAPAGMSSLYFLITRDPSVRPLALTREGEMQAGRSGEANELITAHIHWGTNKVQNISVQGLSQDILNAFYGHGVKARVLIHETPGSNQVAVTYTVGASMIGPFSAYRAAEGISAAIAAYRLTSDN